MLDLSAIESAAASIAASAVRIRDGVAALQSQIDPTAQTRVDAAGTALTAAVVALAAILPATNDNEEPPPPPPAGPPA